MVGDGRPRGYRVPMEAEPPPTDGAPHRWWILAATGAVLGLIVLDETAVGVALPTLREDLGLSALGAHWAVNAYLLVLAGCVAAGGRLGDAHGLRPMLLVGLALFAGGSLSCGFAGSGEVLIAARCLQALGAALVLPISTAMLVRSFPDEQRGLALGLYVSIGGVFLASGPLVGGAVTEALSWRWIFWVNLPVVLGVVLVVTTLFEEPPRPARVPFDGAGLATSLAGIGAFVLGVMQAPDWGWADPRTLASLGGGAALLLLFARIERGREDPLLELDLFRIPTFTAGNLVLLAGQFSKTVVVIFGAQSLQEQLHLGATRAGLLLLVAIVPSIPGATLAGRAADRFGPRRPTLVGLVAMTAALLAVAAALPTGRIGFILPPLLLWGASLPFCFAPPQSAVVGVVAPEQVAQAGGMNRAAQFLGGTLGMAVGGSAVLTTGDVRAAFLAAAGVCVAVLAVAAAALARPAR